MLREVLIHKLLLLRRQILNDFKLVLIVDLQVTVHDARRQRVHPPELHVIGHKRDMRIRLDAITAILLDVLVRLDVAGLRFQLVLKHLLLLIRLVRNAGHRIYRVYVTFEPRREVLLEEALHHITVQKLYRMCVANASGPCSIRPGATAICAFQACRTALDWISACVGFQDDTCARAGSLGRIRAVVIKNQNHDDQHNNQRRNYDDAGVLAKVVKVWQPVLMHRRIPPLAMTDVCIVFLQIFCRCVFVHHDINLVKICTLFRCLLMLLLK